jgi:hypothetical protein
LLQRTGVTLAKTVTMTGAACGTVDIAGRGYFHCAITAFRRFAQCTGFKPS